MGWRSAPWETPDSSLAIPAGWSRKIDVSSGDSPPCEAYSRVKATQASPSQLPKRTRSPAEGVFGRSSRKKDGHVFDAYRAAPSSAPAGGVVIVQEIFGLTPHIRSVVERYASEGFAAIAPALFDRVEQGLVLDYSEIERGRTVMRRLEWPNTLADVQAAIDALGDVPVGVVGFCWGGTVAHVAAIRLPISAAVSYYGTSIVNHLDERPRCPVLYHFGDQDQSIPPESIERIREANPSGIFHVYAGAGHGFDSEGRASFSPEHSALAYSRSIAFLREHVRPASKPPYTPA